MARRGLRGVKIAALDREDVDDITERPLARRTAAKLNEAACRIVRRGDGFGQRKAFLSDVVREAGDLSMTTSTARLLAAFARVGWIKLVRADLVNAMDSKKVDASALSVGNADYNFLEVDPKECSALGLSGARRRRSRRR